METQTQKLPGISKLAFIECKKLSPFMGLKSKVGIPVAVFADTTEIHFSETPLLSHKEETVSGERMHQFTLRFKTNDEIPTSKKLAFVITDADGNSNILGIQESPYPQITVEDSTGTPGGDAKVKSFTVKYNSNQDLIKM